MWALVPASSSSVNISYSNKTGACLTAVPGSFFLRPCTADEPTQLFDYDTLTGKITQGHPTQCLKAVDWASSSGFLILGNCTAENVDDDAWNFDDKWAYDNTGGRISTTSTKGTKWCINSNRVGKGRYPAELMVSINECDDSQPKS
jgi:hypothetical protein